MKNYILSIYSQVRVSTLNTSPIFTNIGTCNSSPVSNVAGFPDVVVVFPANPGSVYVTSSSTNIGGSTANTFPFYESIFTCIFSFKYFKQSPNCSLFNGI